MDNCNYMKKYIVIAVMSLAVLPSAAQDTYENARLLGSDLNGTARYVGMGGALEALGADISTIGTNPAGIGMFRHSAASLSLGPVSQQGSVKFDNLGKTVMSFDQIGFVWSGQTGERSFLNFAFNYHKSRNFDQLLHAANNFRTEASLSKLVYAKSARLSDTQGGYYLDTNDQGYWMGWRNETSTERAYPFTQMDFLMTNAFTMDDVNDADPFNTYAAATDYLFDRAHRGWVNDFDFNISGNSNNRIFWGVTIGLKHANYRGVSSYMENIIDVNNTPRGSIELFDERKLTGTGMDIKAGLILRPIEESPFRIGLSISTPTWYDLKTENWTTIYNKTDNTYYNYGADDLPSNEIYEFNYYTPWKFGLSFGHTIEDYLALGASYEYMSASSADTRIKDDYDDYYYDSSFSDNVINNHTDRTLKGVSLIKLGAEFKPEEDIAIRLGYNYQSSMFNENGVRETTLDAPGNVYMSTADYVNWKATNRVTCGVGYKYDKLNFDLAYQYSMTNGTFYPFQSNVTYTDPYDGTTGSNIATPTDVNFKRHQVLFTIGYTF